MLNRRSFISAGLTAAAAGFVSRVSAQTPTFTETREAYDIRNLRITDLKTFRVDAGNDENFIFVKLYTNQGIVGLGEGTLSNKGATMATAIEEHKRYLVGKDPTEIERHWQGMFRGPRYRGGPVLMGALSAVEIAMWDILGQAVGLPIWRLLGGRARDKVRVYCHEGYLKRISHRKKRKVQSEEEELQIWVDRKNEGWTCVKGGFFPGGGDAGMDYRRSMESGVGLAEKVREVVGPEFDIIMELHAKVPPPWAIEFCNRVEPLRPLWVEEASQQENEVLAELRQIRAQTRVPLGTGERLTTRYDFAPLCDERLVDVITPDVVHCGGLGELRKIATHADTYRVMVSPHTPQSEVSTAASLHVCACTPNCTLLEIGSGMDPFWQDLFHGGLVQVERGYARLPERPGLGLELDETVAAKYPYQEKPWSTLRTPDGAFIDR